MLFQQVWEITSDAMALSDADGIVLAANPAYLSLYGYRQEEVIGNSFAIIFPQAVREQAIAQYKAVFASEAAPAAFESVVHRADGSERIVEANPTFITVQGRRTAMLSTIRDITERRQAQLAEIRQQMIQAQEAERQHLAHEIHDGPLQELAALELRLYLLTGQLTDLDSKVELATLRTQLGQIIQRLRGITITLRPPVAVDQGLASAIHGVVAEISEMEPSFSVTVDLPTMLPDLRPNLLLPFYRITQQALYNVIQHAQANQVYVRLHNELEFLVLEIQDDGQGFSIPENWAELAQQRHLGVVGMFERANLMGGKLEIEAAPGQGTLVRLMVPRSVL